MELNRSLLTCSKSPAAGQISGLWFSSSTAVISGAGTRVRDHCDLLDPINVHPTRQPDKLRRINCRVLSVYLEQTRPPPPFPALTVPWLEFVSCHLHGDFTKVTVCVFFINKPAPHTPQLHNENHHLGRSGETFLVSANVAAWWHINVIYQRVYVAGLVGHFYAPLEQGCCVSA